MSAVRIYAADNHDAADNQDAAFVETYIESATCENTSKAREQALRDATKTLRLNDQGKLLHVRVEDVVTLRDRWKARGLASATTSVRLSVLRELLNRAILHGLIEAPNPAASRLVKPPRVGDLPRSAWLTPPEVRQVMEYLGGVATPPRGKTQKEADLRLLRDRAMIALCLFHGLRVETMTALTPDRPPDWARLRAGGYFRESTGCWALYLRGKGERENVHAVQPGTLQIIRDHLRAHGRRLKGDADPMFMSCKPGCDSQQMQVRSFLRVLKDRLKEAGITGKNVTPHGLRATAATRLLNLGVDLRRVQAFLGHSSLATTERYLRLSTDLADSAALSMEYLT